MSDILKRFCKVSIIIIAIFSLIILIFTSFYVTRNLKCIKAEIGRFNIGTHFDDVTILAVVKVESNFDPTAISDKGAKGLMQIKEETFLFVSRKFGLDYDVDDVFEPAKNIEVGVLYLEYLYEKFGGVDVALCAYNAGEGNVSEWLKDKKYSSDGKSLDDIPFGETKNYLSKIKFYERIYSCL